MLLCLWWFYVQICSAFLWVFHGPFFLDKAHGNCSNSVPNPPLPLTSTPRLHAVFLASHSGLRRTWPQMQCHSVTGCSATCHFAHLVTSEIRVCTTAIKASSSWESPCSLHTGSPGEFQDRIQSNYRVENLCEFTNEYSIVILISWNEEKEASKFKKCVERNVLLHPNDEICTQYIYIYIYLNHWMPSQSSPPSGLGESGASSSMKGTFKGAEPRWYPDATRWISQASLGPSSRVRLRKVLAAASAPAATQWLALRNGYDCGKWWNVHQERDSWKMCKDV